MKGCTMVGKTYGPFVIAGLWALVRVGALVGVATGGPVMAAEPGGACCLDPEGCMFITSSECALLGGDYQGDGVDCKTANCGPNYGACCVFFKGVTCAEVSFAACAEAKGEFIGYDITCMEAECGASDGACCLPDGVCLVMTSSECAAQEGGYQGDGTGCDPNPCPPPEPYGACCAIGEGGTYCEEMTSNGCAGIDGRYQGDDTTCDAVDCTPTGACCLPDGTCEELVPDHCFNRLGIYQGHFSRCEETECPYCACMADIVVPCQSSSGAVVNFEPPDGSGCQFECYVPPCGSDEDCLYLDDGLFCTGEPSCTDGVCTLSGYPCEVYEECDEDYDECYGEPYGQCSGDEDCAEGQECICPTRAGYCYCTDAPVDPPAGDPGTSQCYTYCSHESGDNFPIGDTYVRCWTAYDLRGYGEWYDTCTFKVTVTGGCGGGGGCPDTDRDGVCNNEDNCKEVANRDQADADEDGIGNVCDNCPVDANAEQADGDGDGVGDLCDNCPDIVNPRNANTGAQNDDDDDGIGDACDNCPDDPNANQADADDDGLGDVCDDCDLGPNADADADGVFDACDLCPDDADSTNGDRDQDGIGDVCDNCPDVANASQTDANNDGVGDACEEPPAPAPTQPVPTGNAEGCGVFNGIGLIMLSLSMLLWMGIRIHSRRHA